MPTKSADLDLVREVACELPNVVEARSPRGIGFTVAGKLLACQAIHSSAEPNSLMVRVSPDERARLIAADPKTYYVTDHYREYPAVLVRLQKLRRKPLRELLATAWVFVSEKVANGCTKKRSKQKSRRSGKQVERSRSSKR